MSKPSVSSTTSRNWLVAAGLFISGLAAALSGIYFLYFPVGGYRGGRNPQYGVEILFDRESWDTIHTWGGIAMIVIASLHIALHWSWFVNMIRRLVKELFGQCGCMNQRGRWNLILNLVLGISGILTAISGVYFLLVPGGRGTTDPLLLFSRTTWDLIHTWAGVTMIAAAMLHFVIHWRWVVKVAGKLIWRPQQAASAATKLPQFKNSIKA